MTIIVKNVESHLLNDKITRVKDDPNSRERAEVFNITLESTDVYSSGIALDLGSLGFATIYSVDFNDTINATLPWFISAEVGSPNLDDINIRLFTDVGSEQGGGAIGTTVIYIMTVRGN